MEKAKHSALDLRARLARLSERWADQGRPNDMAAIHRAIAGIDNRSSIPRPEQGK